MASPNKWRHLELQMHRRGLKLRHWEQHLRRRELRLRHLKQLTRRAPELRSREQGSNILDISSDIARRLSSKGYKPLSNGKASMGHALVWAVSRGFEEEVRLLIQEKFNVDYIDTSREDCRQTALHRAAGGGFCSIISMLASAGANLEERSEGGATALLWAAYNGQTESVRLLADLGANIECRDDGGGGLFHAAAGTSSPGLVSLINSCSTSIDVDCCDDFLRTPAHMACYSGNFAALQALVSSGAKINLKDAQGSTPLHVAAAHGHAVMVYVEPADANSPLGNKSWTSLITHRS